MQRSRNETANFALVMAAAGIRGVGQWLFVFILIRVSGPESVGEYGYATALVTPVVALTGLQLPRVIATELPGERDLGSYVAVRLWATLLNAVVLIPVVLMLSRDSMWPVAALVLQTGALGLVEVYQASILQNARLRLYGIINVVTQSAAWGGAAVALYITENMSLALAASGVGILASYAVFQQVFRSNQLPDARPRFIGLRAIVRENLPLGLALLVDALVTHSPRFLLEASHGKFDLGIFVGLLTFLSASTLVSESIGQAATPSISRLVHTGKRQPFDRFVRIVTGFTVVLAVIVPSIAWRLGPDIAGMLLDPTYGAYPFALAGVAMIAVVQFGNRVTTTALNAAKTLGPLFGVNILALLVAIVVGGLMIPEWGVNGAVIALGSANAVRAVFVQLMLRNLRTAMH